MTSIVYQDKASGFMYAYYPQYPAQRNLFELKRNERIQEAIKELQYMANVRLYLYKKGKLRLIADRAY